MAKKFYHNKKRNTALLYEFLIRHISSCYVENDIPGRTKALAISRKFFGKGSALKEELNLFNQVLDTQIGFRESANKIINAICESAEKMNARELDQEKSKLIREINYTFNADSFYSYKIPNYTIYASVQTLLSESRKKNKTLDTVDRIKIEENIVKHLMQEKKEMEPLRINPRYSNTVYKFAKRNFDRKYATQLNENQKKLLTKYSVYLMNENSGVVKSAIQKEVSNVKVELKKIADEQIREDKELMKRLTECYKQFASTDYSVVSEQNILSILQYMSLIDEVNS